MEQEKKSNAKPKGNISAITWKLSEPTLPLSLEFTMDTTGPLTFYLAHNRAQGLGHLLKEAARLSLESWAPKGP